eukprot:3693298-Pleurochrysis_carterae.AAC.6
MSFSVLVALGAACFNAALLIFKAKRPALAAGSLKTQPSVRADVAAALDQSVQVSKVAGLGALLHAARRVFHTALGALNDSTSTPRLTHSPTQQHSAFNEAASALGTLIAELDTLAMQRCSTF